ncbi:MAG: CHAP domain-containing protein [Anaerolineales bacterium]|nr:CHAP domain-containing protein [Anaerolineales bacterium]
MFKRFSAELYKFILHLSLCVQLLLPVLLLLPVYHTRAEGSLQACQCTDYVYRQRADIPGEMGNANQWVLSASFLGLPFDHTPQPGDIAVILNGEHGFNAEYGHVAIVIGINRAHTRFDIAGYDGLKGDCMVEIYTGLPVTTNTVFIHRKSPIYE